MAWLGEVDRGTPPKAADLPPVTLRIDEQTVTVPAGTSIMRAAALAGTTIPKLCATDTRGPDSETARGFYGHPKHQMRHQTSHAPYRRALPKGFA